MKIHKTDGSNKIKDKRNKMKEKDKIKDERNKMKGKRTVNKRGIFWID